MYGIPCPGLAVRNRRAQLETSPRNGRVGRRRLMWACAGRKPPSLVLTNRYSSWIWNIKRWVDLDPDKCSMTDAKSV